MTQKEIIKAQLLPEVIESIEDIERLVVYEMVFCTRTSGSDRGTINRDLHDYLMLRALKKQAQYVCEYYHKNYDNVYSKFFQKNYDRIYFPHA